MKTKCDKCGAINPELSYKCHNCSKDLVVNSNSIFTNTTLLHNKSISINHEEKLERLIYQLLFDGLVSKAWLANALNLPLIDFLDIYKDVINESSCEWTEGE